MNFPSAGAVDLSTLHVDQERKHAVTDQWLRSVGLIGPCGKRIHGAGVTYFVAVEGPIQPPNGIELGLQTAIHVACSRECDAGKQLEEIAIARRGEYGRVTWLDELRARHANVTKADQPSA